jgi:hypothetical protein
VMDTQRSGQRQRGFFREGLEARDGVHEATRAHDCNGRRAQDVEARKARDRKRQRLCT